MSKSAFGIEDSRETVEKFAMPRIPGMSGALKAVSGAGKNMASQGGQMIRSGGATARAGAPTTGGLQQRAGMGMRKVGNFAANRPGATLGIAGASAAGGAAALKPKQPPKPPGMR